MPKILIDTNFFRELYRTKEKIGPILNDIDKVKPHLVIPEQIKDEFIRNRDKAIREVRFIITGIKYENIGIFGLFLGDPDVKDCNDISAKHSEIRRKMIRKCDTMIKNPDKDIFFKYFLKIYNDPKVEKIKRTDEIISKAITRKYLGNPPISKGKNTIGDEVIWESLLSSSSDDLIIVSKDSTYTDHFTFLSREYEEKTQKKFIKISDEISEVLPYFSEEPSKELKAFEKEQDAFSQYLKTIQAWKDLQNQIVHDYQTSITIPLEQFSRQNFEILSELRKSLTSTLPEKTKFTLKEDSNDDQEDE